MVQCDLSGLRAYVATHVHWKQILKTLSIAYVERSTGTLVSLCQFHLEKTPSLHFWNISGRYYCHGCALEGDKLDFVCKYLCLNDVLSFEDKDMLQRFFAHQPSLPSPDQLEINFTQHE